MFGESIGVLFLVALAPEAWVALAVIVAVSVVAQRRADAEDPPAVTPSRVLSMRSRGKNVYYLPGGKREPGESDEACLRREIHEELAVDIKAGTLRKLGVFEAQAHGKPLPIKMACYDADYAGELRASAEVAEFVWLCYADRERCAPVDRIIFDLLRERGELR